MAMQHSYSGLCVPRVSSSAESANPGSWIQEENLVCSEHVQTFFLVIIL